MNIFVILFWVASSGHITDIEEIQMGNSPEICLGLTEDDLKKKTPDYDAEIKKGLTPHLVCGISTEGASSAPSPETDDYAPRKMPNGDPAFCQESEAHLFISQWCHTEIVDGE